MPTEGEQFAEIGIRREQHASAAGRCSKHRVVLGTQQLKVDEVDGVVPSLRQPGSDAPGHRLIDQEPHPAVRSGSSRSSTAAAA